MSSKTTGLESTDRKKTLEVQKGESSNFFFLIKFESS